MTENWQDGFVADIASPAKNALAGGPFGSNLVSKDYVETGIPVIRGQNMGERWISGDFVFVSEEKARQLSPNTVRPADLIFTQRGTLGQVAIVPEKPYEAYIISQSQMKLTVDKEKADTLFVYYVFKSPGQQEYILRNAIQTGVPHTNLEHLRTTPIFLPPLPEQRAVAGILGALDDKIELNRRISRTLDEIGWAIFKILFINNDKANDWEYARTGDKLTTHLGGTPSRDNLEYWNDGTIPWINSGKVNEFRVIDAAEHITQLGLDNSSTKVIPPRSTVIAITGATLGQVSLLEIEACTNQSVVSVLGSDELPSEYVYYWIRYNIDELVSWQTGGAQQHINKNNVNDFKILCPDTDTMQDFIGQVRPIFDLIRNNYFESRTLASLRDNLLPKLMRGEIRVKER
jgi:type I restriction enzyme, S subunit